VDVGDDVLMAARSWRWLRTRILGLLAVPPAGYVEVAAEKGKTRREPIWSTRLQHAVLTTSKGV
jgi:hypothetical protein